MKDYLQFIQYGGSILNNMYEISLHSCSVDGSESNNLKLSLERGTLY